MKFFKMALSVLLLGSFGVATALAQPNDTPTTIVNPPQRGQRVPRLGEPKAQIELDLRQFLAELNKLENQGILNNSEIGAHLSGGRIGFFGAQEWTAYFLAARGKTQFRFDKIEFKSLETDTARVKISYAWVTPNNVELEDGQFREPPLRVVNQSETLDLKREIVSWTREEKWRIAAPTAENLQPYRTLSLQHIAYYASQRAGTLSQLRAEISASRLKQIALGVLQFVQDYDERYRLENEFWREAIRPYVRNDSLYFIPSTQTSYTFNDNLSDKSLADVKEAARTVLFYEGENEKPIFRYDGKAAICFTDGHVKLVTPEEAKTLIWKP